MLLFIMEGEVILLSIRLLAGNAIRWFELKVEEPNAFTKAHGITRSLLAREVRRLGSD